MTTMYDKVMTETAERLIAELEHAQATGKWNRPYQLYVPHNVDTKAEYSGANVYALLFRMKPTAVWGTFNQWKARGYYPAKNTGVPIYSPPLYRRDTDKDGNEVVKPAPPRVFYVYNAHDVTNNAGEQYPVDDVVNAGQVIPHCQDWFAKLPITIELTSAAPSYSRRADVIRMPLFESFLTPELYYSTLAHELVHWAGGAARLNRDTLVKYESSIEIRAREELTAEIGATMLCAALNLPYEAVRDDHIGYISNWLTALKNDKTFLRDALKQAQLSVQYIRSLTDFS